MASKGRGKQVPDKKSSSHGDDMPLYSAENIQHNMRTIYYSRTFLSIVGGVIAGVLGLTSITGFLFYFAIMMATSAAVAVKAGFDIGRYFDSWNRITLDGITAGLMVCLRYCAHILSWDITDVPKEFRKALWEACSIIEGFIDEKLPPQLILLRQPS